MSTKLITIENLNAELVKELQGWEEKQKNIVKANPFIKIDDNKTYEEAKKRRTALLKGRTGIETQDKIIASKIRQFRTDVSQASHKLIEITKPHEDKQQEEVRRYEHKKAEERAEKLRIEQERKDAITQGIDDLYNHWRGEIANLTYKGIENFEMQKTLDEFDVSKVGEFVTNLEEKVQILKELLSEKVSQLEILERQRIEAEKLRVEKEELEAKRLIFQKEQEAKEKKQREEQAKIDAENKRKADELKKQQDIIDEERKRLEKIEADRIEKERKENEAKEQAEKLKAKQKRIEELKPDIEKLTEMIKSINVDSTFEFKHNSSRVFMNDFVSKLSEFKENMLAELGTIK